MKIHVTKEDIKKGKKGDVSACPVGRALNRYKGVECEVGYIQIIVISKDGEAGSIGEISKEVRDFINNFDAGRAVKPFAFDLPPMRTFQTKDI